MEKLISLLEDRNAEYEIIEHSKTIHTAIEGAEYLGIQVGETAPGGTGKLLTTLKIRPRDVEKLNNVVGYIQ